MSFKGAGFTGSHETARCPQQRTEEVKRGIAVEQKHSMHGRKKKRKFGLTAAVFCSVASQCRQVKITILGEEGVPVQVDGEAWIQPPGIVKIVHKNRAQMLTRDRVMSNTCIKFLLEKHSSFHKYCSRKSTLISVRLQLCCPCS